MAANHVLVLKELWTSDVTSRGFRVRAELSSTLLVVSVQERRALPDKRHPRSYGSPTRRSYRGYRSLATSAVECSGTCSTTSTPSLE